MLGTYKTYDEFKCAVAAAAPNGLLFCPSCFNANPVVVHCGTFGISAHYVHCPLCCMRGPEVSICRDTRIKAIWAWNALARPIVMCPDIPAIPGLYFHQTVRYPEERGILRRTQSDIDTLNYCASTRSPDEPVRELWGGPLLDPITPPEFIYKKEG